MPRELSFIDYICQKIEDFDLRHCNLQVVLPSMRLKREIETRLKKRAELNHSYPFWMPGFTTMNQVMENISGLRPAHPAELTAILYQSYRDAYQQKPPKDFDQFWEWGQMLLSDFNQIDNQLAPAEEILQYIAEEKRLGQWNLDLHSHSGQLQNRYLEFYSKLWNIYSLFTTRLLDAGLSYTGLSARKTIETLGQQEYLSKETNLDFFLFAGFNALTKAEESLVRHLIKFHKAEILWNADQYYMDENSLQEAGLFLRRYQKDYLLNHHLKEEDISDRIRQTSYCSIACAQNIGQAKILGRILEQEEHPENTLIVLNDEGLMPAVMNSLPDHLHANISIASPIRGTLASALFQTLFEARDAVRRHPGHKLHSSFIIRLLRNSLFIFPWKAMTYSLKITASSELQEGQPATPGKTKAYHKGGRSKAPKIDFIHYDPLSEGTDQLIYLLIQSKQVYFSKEELSDMLAPCQPIRACLDFIFENDPSSFQENTSPTAPTKDRTEKEIRKTNLLRLVHHICTGFLKELNQQKNSPLLPKSPLEKMFLQELEQQIPALQEMIDRYPDVLFGENSQLKILQSQIENLGIHYLGDPTHNLSLMGVLETRGMEAEHVIMLSTNEGFIPTAHSDQSFLLNSVKRYYSLPTSTERTAMQAYHFYSLLQGCHRATFIYVDSSSDTNNEKSRFLLQLEKELPQQKKEASFEYPFPLYNHRYDQHHELQIEKTPHLMEDLKKSVSTISFSSLSTYLNCPMRYYREKVLRLGEPPVPSDELDVAIKGSIFHKALELFFKGEGPDGINRLNVILTPFDLEMLRKHRIALIEQAAAIEFSGGDYSHGGNYLAFQEILLWMERYAKALEKEISLGELRILTCEKKLRGRLEKAYLDTPIWIYGVVDRMDIYKPYGGKETLRLVDYKTGNLKELEFNDWDLLLEPDGSQALQLLMYLYLYQTENPRNNMPLQACICSVRNRAEMAPLHGDAINGSPIEEIIGKTADFIRDTLAHMLDPNQPIVCTRGEKNCKYCPYEKFCGPGPETDAGSATDDEQ